MSRRVVGPAVTGALVLILVLLGVGEMAVAALTVVAFICGALTLFFLVRRRRAREAAVAGELRYRALLDNLPLVTFVARASDGQLLYASAQLERLLGVSSGDYGRRKDDVWRDRLHPLDRERVLGAWESWISGPRVDVFRSDYRLIGDDGRIVWVEDVTILVPGVDEQDDTFERHLLDVTRQRQLEEQLRQAQRLELLGRLAAGVAHDFNNLLVVISGYAERLASDMPRHAREDGAIAIAGAAERGASLVRQLLAFSRPQETGSKIVDLNELLREFAPMLHRVIGEDIEFELALDRHCLPVDVQPVQFDQVLMNIIVNARDAMPEGGSLTIATETAALEGAMLEELGVPRAAVVTITDTGFGIDPATQLKIFEPFFSTKGPMKGSGLGLATAYGIVKHAGGSVTVSSVPGSGTTFSIYLPLAAGELATGFDSERVSAAPTGGGETVLVVEDEPALQELERLMLEEAGYSVLTASNASEALVLAEEHSVDVLLVDVVMPGMSGPQLVEELAARGPDMPAVYVSGYGADELSSRRVRHDHDALLEKPFQADMLLRTVREVLDQRPSPARHDDSTVRLVRCLACDTVYGQPERRDAVASAGCPRCGYIGWTGAS